MPTDTIRSQTRAVNFALRAVAWSLGLFGLLRLNWVEIHGLLPLTRLQARLAVGLCGTPAFPIDATLACSGADALALCVGAILAYPASWRMRLAGAGGGLTLVLGLNTLRIATLGRVAASPAWFETLHLYVWPAALVLAVAGYVFGWMRFADGGKGIGSRVRESVTREAPPSTVSSPARLTPRFIFLTAVFLLLFTAASPLYLESAGVLTVAAFIARAAAAALHVFGVEARAAANVLWTSRGGFVVTQECISTPLIPVYLAAVFAYASTWRQRALGLVATAPLFVGLGIARLLVVALPAALVASPLYLIHAFYQLLLAAAVVAAAAFWRHGAGRTGLRRALMGMALGVAVACLLGAPYAHVLAHAAEMIGGGAPSGVVAGTPLDDPQGAITLLPAFQVGLYMAIWVAAFVAVGWRRFLTGLVLLELIQMATLVTLHVLASHSGLTPHVRDVRAWAVVGPLLVVVAVHFAATRHDASKPGVSKSEQPVSPR
ncbi:MAG: archaeosortase/exosortase family protein [Acidobacteria bacterium]|nr:archaeosortase/exosortase family protein [Acidobacteriota bacterium]